MSRWAEVWTQPETGTFQRKIAWLPWSRVGMNHALNKVGSGSIEIPANYRRLDEITDPANDLGSMIRLYDQGTHMASFYADEVEYDEEEQGTVTVTGQGIEAGLEFGQVYPWDWTPAATETKFPDWVYGMGSNDFYDPSFEDDPTYPLRNGDAEDGTTSGWSTYGSGDNCSVSLDIINNPTNAYEGDFFFKVDPCPYHSGVKQSGIKVYPGKRNQFTARIKEPGALGRRFTFGATVEKGFYAYGLNQFDYDQTVMAELGNVASNGSGTPGGSSDGTWQELQLDIQWGSKQTETDIFAQFDHHKQTDGPEFWLDAVTMTGFGVGVGDWEPVGYEYMDAFEGSIETAHTGTRSLKINADGSQALGGVGVQKEVAFEEGAPYYVEVWLYSATAGDPTVRVSALQKDGRGVIETTTVDLAQYVWTRVRLEFEPAEGIHFGYIAIAIDETTDTTIFIDDTLLRTGLPPATAGYILKQHLDLITARDGATSALEWLKYDSFNALTDSNGVAWPEELAIRVPRGQNVRQLMDQFKQWGYEWEIVWNDGASQFELLFYTKFDGTDGGAGNDSDVKLTKGKSFRQGTVRLRDAGPNTFLAEGLEGSLYEKGDATLKAGYGRREGYLPQPRTEESVTLESMIDAALVVSKNQKYGVKGSVFARPFPVIDFQMGDRIHVDLPPHLPADQYRVLGYTGVWAVDQETTYTLDFSSHVFDQPFGGTTSTATSAGLNYLLGKYEGLPDVERIKLEITTDPTLVKESVPTMMVASYNTRQEVQNHADVVCLGTGDYEEIQVALDQLQALGKGTLIISDGDFLIGNSALLSVAKDVNMFGLGMYVSILRYPEYGIPPSITAGENCELADFGILPEEGC